MSDQLPVPRPDEFLPPDKLRGALVRVLDVVKGGTSGSAALLLKVSALGAIVLAGATTLPPALALLVAGIGVNELHSILQRVARGELAEPQTIREEITILVERHGSGIEQALESNEFQRGLAKLFRRTDLLEVTLRQGQGEIARALATAMQQYEVLRAEWHSDLQTLVAGQQQLAEGQQVLSRQLAELLDITRKGQPQRPPPRTDGRPATFMADDPPDNFVSREQMKQLLALLLAEGHGAVGITSTAGAARRGRLRQNHPRPCAVSPPRGVAALPRWHPMGNDWGGGERCHAAPQRPHSQARPAAAAICHQRWRGLHVCATC